MNWCQKIANWKQRGLDAGEHLHQAFMTMFRTTDVSSNVFEHVDSGLIYYVSSMNSLGSSRGGGREELGFNPKSSFSYKDHYFVFNDRMYRLEVPLGQSSSPFENPALGDKIKQIDIHGLVGTLVRIFDDGVSEYVKMGVIKGDDPLQFSQNVESVIKADWDDDNEELSPNVNPIIPDAVPVGSI